MMKIKQLLKVLFFVSLIPTWCSAENIAKFIVDGSAENVKIHYRLAKKGAEARVSFSNSSSPVVLTQAQEGVLETKVISLTPGREDYEMDIQTDQLVVLRIAASKAVTGLKSIASTSLLKLNLDETKLVESPSIDLSLCPNLEEITLSGCDVTSLTFPQDKSKLKSIIASPSLNSAKGLKSLDLEGCTSLETLGLQGVEIPVIDVRSCKESLRQLTIRGVSNRLYPKELLGGKDLKKLNLVNISSCAIPFSQLPDLNETLLDNFKIHHLYWCYISPDQISGLTIDMSAMKRVKGISETLQETQFVWYQKVAGKWVEEPLALGKDYTEENGVFTFSRSLLDEKGMATVRCQVTNPGYPNCANNTKTGLLSYNCNLKVVTPKIMLTTKASVGEEFSGENFIIGSGEADELKDVTIEGLEKTSTGYRVTSQNITITGYIKELTCNYVKITNLDLTQSPDLEGINCRGNEIQSIDLSQNKKLTYLSIGSNPLQELDLKATKKLVVLNCRNMPNLTSLEIEGLPALEMLYIEDCVKLGDLDFSQNKLLSSLYANNSNRKTLDLKANPDITDLYISGNQIKQLDLSLQKNLEVLHAQYNQINSCVLSSEAPIYEIYIFNNNLTREKMYDFVKSLGVVPEGEEKPVISIVNNSKTIEDHNICTKAIAMIAQQKGYKLTDFNATDEEYMGQEYPYIAYAFDGKQVNVQVAILLEASDTVIPVGLEEIQKGVYKVLQANGIIESNLSSIVAKDIKLSQFDATHCSDIKKIDVSKNQIEALDLKDNEKLEMLIASENKLSSCVANAKAPIAQIAINGNQLKANAVEKFIISLPNHSADALKGKALISVKNEKGEEGNAFDEAALAMIRQKGWNITTYNGNNFLGKERISLQNVNLAYLPGEKTLLVENIIPGVEIALYSIDGKCLRLLKATASNQRFAIDLEKGVYLVKIADKTFKIIA